MLTSGTTLLGTVTTWDCSMSLTTGLLVFYLLFWLILLAFINFRRLMQLSCVKYVELEKKWRICYHEKVL